MDRRTQQTLFFLINIILIGAIIYIATGFFNQNSNETLVTTNTLTVTKGRNASSSFNYQSQAIQTSMEVGCTTPASMKINVKKLVNPGSINVTINGNLYATASITTTGYALLASGCGCATACVCEIQSGENVFTVISSGFEGEVEYEVYVKK